MAEDAKVQQLEDEFKLLKNEIKHVLTDIEEFILDARNPFRAAAGSSRLIGARFGDCGRRPAGKRQAGDRRPAGRGAR